MNSDAGTQRAPQMRPGGEATAWLSLCAVGLMWSLPFLQPLHYYPLPAFYSEWLAFALGLAALALLAGPRAWRHGELPAIAAAPVALAGLILLQAALQRVPYAGQAVGAAYYLVWCGALVVLGAELERRLSLRTVAAVLAWALVCGGVLTAGAGVLQYYGLEAAYEPYLLPASGGVYGNLAQRNHYADYLCLAIASSAYLYASGRMRVAVAVPVAALLVFGLGASASRGAWLYLATALAMAALYRRREQSRTSARLLRHLAWVAAGFAAHQLLLTAFSARETTVDRLLYGAGLDARLQIARSALDMFVDFPLLGAGWGRFPWLDFEFRAALAAPVHLGVTQNAHNLLLHALAETGVAGALIVAAGAALWLRDAWKSAPGVEWCWLVTLAGILGAHSMLEFPLWQSYFLGVASVAAGLASRCRLRLPLRRVAAAGCVAILLAGAGNAAMLAYEYRQFERLSAAGRRDVAATVDALAAVAARDVVLRPFVELGIANRMEVNGSFLAEKLALNGRVLRFFPAPMVVFRHAVLLALAGQADDAIALFTRAARVYPGALPQVVDSLGRLEPAYPAQIAPLLELASAKMPSPAVPAP